MKNAAYYTEIIWGKAWEHFNKRRGIMESAITESRQRSSKISEMERKQINKIIGNLKKEQASGDPSKILKRLEAVVQKLYTAYCKYSQEIINPMLEDVVRFLDRRKNQELILQQTARSDVDLNFGPAGSSRKTALGHILSALDNYNYSRYRIESGVFWTHLEQTMTGDLLDEVRNQRILLDFALALATLFALAGALTLIVGPWIWLTWIWLTPCALAAVLSWLSFRLALPAAVGLSRAMRAGWDLNRRELLASLGVDLPDTLEKERFEWTKLSQLSVYGYTDPKALLTFKKEQDASPTAPS